MKKYLFQCLTSFITTLTVVSMTIWLIDPLMFFRVNSWHKPVYFPGQQRFQNIGIALNDNYDSVIIGTSMAENFSTNQIHAKMGWKTINLAMSGSSAYEQQRLLQVAIKTGKVKNVLWLVQWDSFAHPLFFVRKDAISPEWFYNDNKVAVLNNYLLNLKILKLSARVFFDNHNNMDTAWNWAASYKFGCASVTDNYNNTSRDSEYRKALVSGDVLTDEHALAMSVQKNLSDVVKKYPNVKFYLIIPPYSKWIYESHKKFGDTPMAAVLNFRKNVATLLNGLSNVKISDYQSDSRIILNANNYKDLTHYSPQINSMMIDEIAKGLFLPIQPQSKFLSQITLRGNCLNK